MMAGVLSVALGLACDDSQHYPSLGPTWAAGPWAFGHGSVHTGCLGAAVAGRCTSGGGVHREARLCAGVKLGAEGWLKLAQWLGGNTTLLSLSFGSTTFSFFLCQGLRGLALIVAYDLDCD